MSLIFKNTKSGAVSSSSRGQSAGFSLEQLRNHQIKLDSIHRAVGISRVKLESFGIKDSKGHTIALTWGTTGIREHGYVGKIVPMSRCNKDMLNTMFKGWN